MNPNRAAWNIVVSYMVFVTPCFPNNVNNVNNQSIQRKTGYHTTKLYK